MVVAGVDIGIFIKGEVPTREEVEEAVRRGPPNDSTILFYKLPNGEDVHRDWLVWSESKQALFCFPCRLFTPSSNTNHSLLASSTGYSKVEKAIRQDSRTSRKH